MVKIFKNKITSLDKIFIVTFVLCIIEAILYAYFFGTNGNYFYFSRIKVDPGGDFYLSIVYSSNLTPYNFAFPYPPLAVLFFYFVKKFNSSFNAIEVNLENFQYYLDNIISNCTTYKIIFLLVTILVLISLFFIIYKVLLEDKSELLSIVIAILLVLNSGYLSALFRGNTILVCIPLVLYFIIFCNNSDFTLNMLAIFLLSVAINIKPYVAIYAALYLFNKRYKYICYTAIFTALLFFIPMFFLNGEYHTNVYLFFKKMLSFYGYNNMIGFSSLINSIFKINNTQIFFRILILFFGLVFCGIIFLTGFRAKKHWQKVLSLTLILILLPQNYGYILSFMMIPLLFFLKEESSLKGFNLIIMLLLLFLTAPFILYIGGNTLTRVFFCNIVLILLALLHIIITFYKTS